MFFRIKMLPHRTYYRRPYSPPRFVPDAPAADVPFIMAALAGLG